MGGEVAKFQLPGQVVSSPSFITVIGQTSITPVHVPVHCPSVQATYPRLTHSIRGGKPPVLHIHVSLNVEGQTFLVKALIDTGAEVNIIRRGIIPPELLRRAETPISLSTADSSAIQGGKLGVSGLANLRGHERDLKIPVDVQCPVHFYEAVIAAEAILSYGWLGQHNFHIIPRNHCLEFRDDNSCVWISGISHRNKGTAGISREGRRSSRTLPSKDTMPRSETTQYQGHPPAEHHIIPESLVNTPTELSQTQLPLATHLDSIFPLPGVPEVEASSLVLGTPPPVTVSDVESSGKRPRMLDLFSGTNSVGDVFLKRGYEVVSVDNQVTYNPTICTDVQQWDYKTTYPVGYFDVIAASPPCTEYSTAMTSRLRRLKEADDLVLLGLAIIGYFMPVFWFMENPRRGLLKERTFMHDLPFVDVDYCQFSDWGYQKPTRIWGSPQIGLLPRRVCDNRTCPNRIINSDGIEAHRHILGTTPSENQVRVPRDKQYRIPEGVISYIAGWGISKTDGTRPNPPAPANAAAVASHANTVASHANPVASHADSPLNADTWTDFRLPSSGSVLTHANPNFTGNFPPVAIRHVAPISVSHLSSPVGSARSQGSRGSLPLLSEASSSSSSGFSSQKFSSPSHQGTWTRVGAHRVIRSEGAPIPDDRVGHRGGCPRNIFFDPNNPWYILSSEDSG